MVGSLEKEVVESSLYPCEIKEGGKNVLIKEAHYKACSHFIC